MRAALRACTAGMPRPYPCFASVSYWRAASRAALLRSLLIYLLLAEIPAHAAEDAANDRAPSLRSGDYRSGGSARSGSTKGTTPAAALPHLADGPELRSRHPLPHADRGVRPHAEEREHLVVL